MGRIIIVIGVAGIVGLAVLWKQPSLIEPPRPQRIESLDPDLVDLINSQVSNVAAHPHNANHWGDLGLLYEANEIWNAAVECFQKAAQLDSSQPVWPYHQCLAYRKGSNASAGSRLLESLITQFPGFAPGHFEFGVALLEQGDLRGAEQAFGAAHDRAANRPEPLIGLATVMVHTGRADQALALTKQALRIAPDFNQAHYVQGLAYRALGDRDAARTALRRGEGALFAHMGDEGTKRMQRFYTGIAVILDRAAMFIDADRHVEAITLLDRALKRRPGDSRLLNNLGIALLQNRQLDRAVSVLEQAKAAQPDAFPTYINLTEAFIALKRYEDALRTSQEAVAIAPELGQAHFALGRALFALQRHEEAYVALAATLRRDTRNPEAYYLMGATCAALGRFDEGLPYLVDAGARMPDYLAAQLRLATVALRIRNIDAAISAVAAIERLAPDHAALPRLRTQMEILTSP
jgi:tetratricopeptide (TPR) repeat protein